MRHRNTKAILNRPADQRRALMRNQMTSLFLSGAIKTTDAKAKALRSEVEKLITRVKSRLAKKEEASAIRELKKVLYTEASQRKALAFIRETKQTSGYTRLVRVDYRAGDAALEIQVQLLSDKE